MIQELGTWGTVEIGDYVKDGNGKTWKVAHFGTSEITGHRGVTLADRDGVAGTIPRPPDDRPVVKLVKSPFEKAAELVRLGLGGQILATRGTAESQWHTPEMADLDWGKRHMLDMHHVDCEDVTDLARLVELHDATPAAVPHDHDHALRV